MTDKEHNIKKIDWREDVITPSKKGAPIYLDKITNLPLTGVFTDSFEDVYYFQNGKCHRLDGPAAIYSIGGHNYVINGLQISNNTMNEWLIENDIPVDWRKWSDEDKMVFALHWYDYNG